ncbi:hypothetical protein COCOBI_05-0780 [Coccomyxa sp. Obi]|nr:hypothetical protein COCOBI_05-0780 [Coccomyxa sp. Obi]
MVSKTLVIAVDNSTECLKAMDFAFENFPTGYTYHHVHIQPRPLGSSIVGDADAAFFARETPTEEENKQIDTTKKFMYEIFAPRAKAAGVEALTVIVETDSDSSRHIAKALCQYAEKFKAEALVMMRHHEAAALRHSLGSVTQYCAVHNLTPVVVVPNTA